MLNGCEIRAGICNLAGGESQWQQKGEYLRLKVLELLLVKGWANRDVAKFLKIGEQQVAMQKPAPQAPRPVNLRR